MAEGAVCGRPIYRNNVSFITNCTTFHCHTDNCRSLLITHTYALLYPILYYLGNSSRYGSPGVQHAGEIVPLFQSFVKVATPRSLLVIATHAKYKRASVLEVSIKINCVSDAGGLGLYARLVVWKLDVVKATDVDFGILQRVVTSDIVIFHMRHEWI